MTWPLAPTTISEKSEKALIYDYSRALSIFEPPKTRDFLTGGNSQGKGDQEPF